MTHRLYREWFGGQAGTTDGRAVVLLHEGLGSVSTWGRFPDAVAEATGWPVLAYDRAGYGRSGPKPGPWPARFMHDEAVVLGGLLADEGVAAPVFVGHSDGGSIALLYPECAAPNAPAPLGIVSLAAHVMVEPISVASIEALRAIYDDGLNKALARHHEDADAMTAAWSEAWVSDRFSDWAIDDELAAVTCDVVAIQGADDSYGTSEQLVRLAAAVSGRCDTVELDGVDHWPHREATDRVLDEIVGLIERVS